MYQSCCAATCGPVSRDRAIPRCTPSWCYHTSSHRQNRGGLWRISRFRINMTITTILRWTASRSMRRPSTHTLRSSSSHRVEMRRQMAKIPLLIGTVAHLSQLPPEPDNGGWRAHHEILRVAEYQGSKDCCTRLRVGEKDGDEAERCDPGRERFIFFVSDPHTNSRIQFRGDHFLNAGDTHLSREVHSRIQDFKPSSFWLCEWPPVG